MDTSMFEPYLKNYREALRNLYASTRQNQDNTRDLKYGNIMSSANTAGMMYSNFPERSKMQYVANTYIPSTAKAYTTYTTGLDTLRRNIANTYNIIKEYENAGNNLGKSSNNGGQLLDGAALLKAYEDSLAAQNKN